MLTFRNVTYRLGERILLDDVNVQVYENQKFGLVGRNGSGKTSLFNLILNIYQCDNGTIEIARNTKIVTVAQQMPDGDITPIEFILQSDHKRSTLMHKLETCTDPNKMAHIYEQLLDLDAFSSESRAATILKGLGFDEDAQQQPLTSFSGGYRMRIALGVALFQKPDLLLLDEPTNHLDLETMVWLRNYLKKATYAVIIISHDREFLNDTIDYILHLSQRKINLYTGNFDQFIELFTQKQNFIEAYNAKLQAQKAHMLKFVERYRAKASKAKQAQSRLKSISKLNFIPTYDDENTINLEFTDPEVKDVQYLNFEKINLGYNDKIVLRHIHGSISSHDRIALLGANGNGKSTFAKFLQGELLPFHGTINRYNKLRIGYYRQNQLESLDLNSTPYDLIQHALGHNYESRIRAHLGKFGFTKERALQKIGTLSGGEQARLIFCQITTLHPNMLILDEPTNHLDLEMRESLIRALNDFAGAIILITHDRHLLRYVADQLWVVKNHTITNFRGSIDDYYQEIGN